MRHTANLSVLPGIGAHHRSSSRPVGTTRSLKHDLPVQNLLRFQVSKWRRRPSWRRGTAALEFALSTPLLLIMVGGAADLGLAQFYRTNLANAVAAGAQYAFLIGTGVNTMNIQTVVQSAMFLPVGGSSNLSVSFVGSSPGVQGPGWYCVTGTGPTVAASSKGSTCSDGSSAGYYIWIKASYISLGLLGGILPDLNRTISEQVTVRLQ